MTQKRNNLVALSSAAVLAVYAAGYVRTRGTTEAFAKEPGEVQPALPPRAAPAPAPVAEKIAITPPAAEPAPKKARKTAPKKDSVKKSEPMIAMAILDSTKHDSLPEAPVPPAPVAAKQDTTPKADSTKQAPKLKDGVWHGYGTSRHGDIEAEVEIKNGRITAARISGCYTRYSCSWIDPLLPQVVERQSHDVDYISGATQSSDAFRYAVWEALSRAK